MERGLIEKIKERVSCIDYMQREHGAQIVNDRTVSYRPDATNPTSMLVHDRDWHDFGDGKGGDIIDLVALDKFDGDKGRAIRFLANSCGLRAIVPSNFELVFKAYRNLLDDACTFYQSCLRKEHVQYMHGRGLTDKTIKELRIGFADNPCPALREKGYEQEKIAESGILSLHNRLIIPYLKNEKAVYFIGRQSEWGGGTQDAKYKKLMRTGYSEHPIWGAESLKREGIVMIAEGIFDAISCWQEGYPVITAVTGSFSSEQKKDLFPMLKGREVCVCMDYDPKTHAGQKFTQRLAQELFEHGIHTRVAFLHGDGVKKDLSSMYALHPCRDTIEEVIGNSEDYGEWELSRIAELPSELEKRKQVKAFFQAAARVFDNGEVYRLVSCADGIGVCNPEWFRELAKSLSKPPSEMEITKEFLNKNDLAYNEALGFHEWDGTCWNRVNEASLGKRINTLYGKFACSKRVSAIINMLRYESPYVDKFNVERDTFNFPNGMFNVATGDFSAHRRGAYSTIKTEYDYDPKAKCPRWIQFVEEVANGDIKRINMIQEMFGYCLTKDTRYQKCFCLIGDGANGKSVLLQILEALVGEVNTSHVEIAHLDSPFERIQLLNSMVNICNDMKSDFAGTEAYFKGIVAGDPISACYKGKDNIQFKPFCKMVFALNNMITPREADYSIARRICYIDFPVSFSLHPENGEKQADIRLANKLLDELPGIFNWAFEGLHVLRTRGYFVETEEQKKREEEMAFQANPVLAFYNEVIAPGAPKWTDWITRKEAYQEYVRWCNENNVFALSTYRFLPALRKTCEVKEKGIAGCRYICCLPKAKKSY